MRFSVCVLSVSGYADENISVDLPRLYNPQSAFITTNLNCSFVGHYEDKVLMSFLDGEYMIYQFMRINQRDFYAWRCLEFHQMSLYSYIFRNYLVIWKNNGQMHSHGHVQKRNKIYVYDIPTMDRIKKIHIPSQVDFECDQNVLFYFEQRNGRRRVFHSEVLVE